MQNLLFIGIGGFLGAVARYAAGIWIDQKWGRVFPLGTFFINISGCFLIGLLMTLFTERLMLNPQWRMFFIIGFLGSYTTFSTFGYETNSLMREGEWFIAILNAALSVIIGFAAVRAGEGAARLL